MRNFAFDLKPFARLASMSGRIEFLTFDYVFLFLFIFLFIWLRFYEWIFQFVGLKSFLITLSNPHKSFSLSLRTKRPKCADSRRVNLTRKQLWLKEISNNNEIETIWCELHFTGFFFYLLFSHRRQKLLFIFIMWFENDRHLFNGSIQLFNWIIIEYRIN